ncbi:cytochrome c peroxidase [Shimia haliotis]|uniref:Methylamine utilization protein MauG n=1 Tax=Shimia haliotis TaxID=1280847 RepID=A0A1I4AZ85_9RHOB|nr:cytochrome c peroxidase [Shimia haliotis]
MLPTMCARVAVAGFWVLLGAFAAHAQTSLSPDRQDFRRPTTIPFPESAPYSREIATLGKMLFFDPRLSKHQNMSCASCHNPSFGWEAPVARAIGAKSRPLSRHTPTVLNQAWSTSFFWDGRAQSLEQQAVGPLTAASEMAASFDLIFTRLSAVPLYRTTFERLFPEEGINKETVLRSLATYERTLVAANAPFDRWVEGDETAISEKAKRGFNLFVGQAGCAACHAGWAFTDGGFYDVGSELVLYAPVLSGDGETGRPKLKVPTLRNISLRAPYTHLGGFQSLEDLIWHYSDAGTSLGLSGRLDSAPFSITAVQVAEIVAFLETLTEEGAPVRAPVLPSN